jgi:hypothetical protein
MLEWIGALTSLQTVFFVFATLGGLLFVIQLVLMLVGVGGDDIDIDGGGADIDVDAGADIDAGAGADIDAGADVGTDADSAHADSDVGFKLLSYQGLTAFFMMFGLVGLAMNRGSGYGSGASIGVGLAAGAFADLVVASLFRLFSKLQSSGTMNLANAIGQEGRIYLTIRADEPGKIEVVVQGRLQVFDAVSEDGDEVPTDTRVKVVKIVSGNTMVVKRV